MTKIEYIDFIRNGLSMVDKTAKYHRAQVEMAINFAANTVFYDLYEENPKSFRKDMARYATISSLSVATALGETRYTSSLTYDIIDLPRKSGGVIEILPLSSNYTVNVVTTYVPVSPIEGRQLYGSEASLPGNVIGYSLIGPKLIEYWGMDAATAANGVTVRYIRQFKEYASTDNVVLPYGQDSRILELVREYLGQIPPKDLVNTNADING